MSNSNGFARVLSEWQARGDWRLFFVDRDEVAKVTPADVTRVCQEYFLRSNRTAGVFLPTERPIRRGHPAHARHREAGSESEERRGGGGRRILQPHGGEHSKADEIRRTRVLASRRRCW